MNVRCFTLGLTVIVLTSITVQPNFGQAVTSLDDIGFWVGSGANKAALAIDWNGQSSSDAAYVWGYRWEGVASGADMLLDVISADSRLYAKLGTIAGLGTATVGLGYDQNNDHLFELTDHAMFDQRGISSSGLSDGATSLDLADHYSEGWFLGFWHLGFAAGNPFDGNPFDRAAFSSTSFGVDGVTLADESWLSLAFTTDTLSANDFAANPFAAAAPLFADFDSDDDVDGADFLTWQRGFGTWEGALREQGDANDDQRVDQLDLQLWSAALGDTLPLGAASTIPEPGTTAQLLGTAVVATMLTFPDATRTRRKGPS